MQNMRCCNRFGAPDVYHVKQDSYPSNFHPIMDGDEQPVVVIKQRLTEIFPEINVSNAIVNWHLQQHKNNDDLSQVIENICAEFVSQIFNFGQIIDPTKDDVKNDKTITSTSATATANGFVMNYPNTVSVNHVQFPSTSTAAAASTILSNDNKEELQTLFEVFNTIPRPYITTLYNTMSHINNPNWHDDIVNELLTYNERQQKPSSASSSTTSPLFPIPKSVTSTTSGGSLQKRFQIYSTTPPTITTEQKKRSLSSVDDSIDIENLFINDEYERILAILPDCDPEYAMEEYSKYLRSIAETHQQQDLNNLITSMIERGYTKIKDKIEQNRNERLKENISNPIFEIEDFLRTFPNPLEYFYDCTKTMSESYQRHAYIYLANAFTRVPSEQIKTILIENNYRFSPSLKQLKTDYNNYHQKSKSKSNDGEYEVELYCFLR
ncbi:unnamed protein product [Didymodactylos carnosus]|uniref:Uncharacterized protein n=1 Tax=Didymodactylos carnosus TaxID=1234261 RepID=A0A815S9L2_9BILA|nr:unnamed protein product [Didymodactylos carnosus]CAF1488054.1 unnamed protein product [Didymodactylos carnosus]CAF4092906.1 unnamed protein product [Didymodactylos carnosus]CAF4351696.1 unnamed protein product [Didymodactylos carnosus]